jgi:hypothetical protein
MRIIKTKIASLIKFVEGTPKKWRADWCKRVGEDSHCALSLRITEWENVPKEPNFLRRYPENLNDVLINSRTQRNI